MTNDTMPKSAASRGLVVSLPLEGRLAVVVGARRVGLRRARSLAAVGARVVVVAPLAVDEVRQGARDGRWDWHERHFEAADCDGAAFVVAATDDARVNEEVQRCARQAGALCSRADDAAASDAHVLGQATEGAVTLAWSTHGCSPSWSAALGRFWQSGALRSLATTVHSVPPPSVAEFAEIICTDETRETT